MSQTNSIKLCCLSHFLFKAISNEQQTRDCNVAFTTLHRLLLYNVHSAHFRVSFAISDMSTYIIFFNVFLSFLQAWKSLKHFNLFCRPYAAANFYQRALLANALTSALRLHQRLPHIQLSRAFLAQALQEDSCHYLLFSLILVNSYPITSIL